MPFQNRIPPSFRNRDAAGPEHTRNGFQPTRNVVTHALSAQLTECRRQLILQKIMRGLYTDGTYVSVIAIVRAIKLGTKENILVNGMSFFADTRVMVHANEAHVHEWCRADKIALEGISYGLAYVFAPFMCNKASRKLMREFMYRQSDTADPASDNRAGAVRMFMDSIVRLDSSAFFCLVHWLFYEFPLEDGEDETSQADERAARYFMMNNIMDIVSRCCERNPHQTYGLLNDADFTGSAYALDIEFDNGVVGRVMRRCPELVSIMSSRGKQVAAFFDQFIVAYANEFTPNGGWFGGDAIKWSAGVARDFFNACKARHWNASATATMSSLLLSSDFEEVRLDEVDGSSDDDDDDVAIVQPAKRRRHSSA